MCTLKARKQHKPTIAINWFSIKQSLNKYPENITRLTSQIQYQTKKNNRAVQQNKIQI